MAEACKIIHGAQKPPQNFCRKKYKNYTICFNILSRRPKHPKAIKREILTYNKSSKKFTASFRRESYVSYCLFSKMREYYYNALNKRISRVLNLSLPSFISQ